MNVSEVVFHFNCIWICTYKCIRGFCLVAVLTVCGSLGQM